MTQKWRQQKDGRKEGKFGSEGRFMAGLAFELVSERWAVYWFAWAAITQHHRRGGVHNRIFIFSQR